MISDKALYQIALTCIDGVGDIIGRNLLKIFGDEETLFKSARKDFMSINGLNAKVIDAILDKKVLLAAEKELEFVEKNKLQLYFLNDDNYPLRLKECADAPLLLYAKGVMDLNAQKIISIVGTRNSTNYGSSFCEQFLSDLSLAFPNTLIVSGLAYGIDISAHRSALKSQLPTVGVLAHGMDRIYPSAHRQTAVDMLANGGLITEFGSGTQPDKFNFVRRNRIVAGICDALIVVESNAKGGSLITAEMANSYCKDVFSLPGRTSDSKSEGCNALIANHKADLFLSTEYFLKQMGWDDVAQKKTQMPKQQSLFVDLDENETLIVSKLENKVNVQIEELSELTQLPVYQLLSILFEMEMKGLVKTLPGNRFALK